MKSYIVYDGTGVERTMIRAASHNLAEVVAKKMFGKNASVCLGEVFTGTEEHLKKMPPWKGGPKAEELIREDRDMVEIETREEFEADRKARLAEIGEKGLGLSRAELLEAVDGVEA